MQANTAPAPAPAPAPAAPAPGTPEYDAAMAAKFDKANADALAAAGAGKPPAAPEAPPARPEGVPEKFWDAATGQVNVEALLKSYTELEKARSKPAETPPAPQSQEPKQGDQAAAEGAVAQAGLDMAALSAKVDSQGKLDDSDYEAFQKVGISKEYVDAYIAGQQALAKQFESDVLSTVGGRESFDKMADWAAKNFSAGEIEAFDAAVNGTPEQAKLALAALQARFVAANGSEPRLLGGSQGVSSEAGFASNAEMTAAMRDPRYATDPAYRAKVAAKVAAMPQTGLVTNVY